MPKLTTKFPHVVVTKEKLRQDSGDQKRLKLTLCFDGAPNEGLFVR